jgi:hypothetical protein
MSSLTVNLRSASGEIRNRNLTKGVGVSVYGKVFGLILPSSFSDVRFEIPELSYVDNTSTNAFGSYSFWFVPTVDNQALTFRLLGSLPTGMELVDYPVGVGKVIPAKLPKAVTSSTLDVIGKYLLIAGIIVGALIALPYILPLFNKRSTV